MRALYLSIALLAALVLAACAPSPPSPTPVGTPLGSNPTAAASSGDPTPSVAPSKPAPATPAPTLSPTTTPSPATAQERFLLAGIREDAAVDCAPRRDGLPPRAIAGVECRPRTALVDRVGFYLFPSDKAMLDTYFERLAAEGIRPNVGSCYEGEGEQNFVPGEVDAAVVNREGCFLNEYGIANYRAALPGEHVYVGILGTNGNTRALQDWAWRFNQDVPGAPTVWMPGR